MSIKKQRILIRVCLYGLANVLWIASRFSFAAEPLPADIHDSVKQVLSDVRAGNTAKANLFAMQFKDHPDFAASSIQIADAFCHKKKYDEGMGYFQATAGKISAEEYAIQELKYKAWKGIKVKSDDTVTISDWVKELKSKYGSHSTSAIAAQQIGDVCRRDGKVEDAKELYQFVVENQPQHEYAIWSQRSLAQIDIQNHDFSHAEQNYQKLMANYSDRTGIALCVTWIGNSYYQVKELEKSRSMYQYAVDHWPEDEYALEAMRGMISIDILTGQYDTVKANLETMVSKYSSRPDIAESLYGVANDWLWAMEKEKAKMLYEYVHSKWPGESCGAKSRLTLLILDYGEGNAEADAKALSEFDAISGSRRHLYELAKGYVDRLLREMQRHHEPVREWGAVKLRKALALFAAATDPYPESSQISEAILYMADCHRYLGEVEKALEHYQKVVRVWPNFKYSWKAQYRIGQAYQTMKGRQLMSGEQADALTAIEFQKLITNYPDCRYAPFCAQWLNDHTQK